MSAFTEYAAECESNAVMLPNEKVATMTAYAIEKLGGIKGLPVSGDALAVMNRGYDGARMRRRRLAARMRMEAQECPGMN